MVFALVLNDLDNIILDNYDRKMATYLELGWDKQSIHEYISKKENMGGKIASFNTNKVSFTASSRRNRFYEVYNRPDLLEKDKLFPDIIESLIKIAGHFDIFIVSGRTEDLKDKTLEVMEKLDLPMNRFEVYFKKTHEMMQSYRRSCLVDIKAQHPTGIGIILNPNDANLFERFDYTPVGYTTIKNKSDFDGKCEVVCENWIQLVSAIGDQ
ncbi:MAG: hypothetical protein GY870_19900 [archaeon]|nr:hypothetical protein [archaeon]